MNNKKEANSGIGFCGMLAILFIGLKLAKIIKWSWLWVLSPLWIPIFIFFSIILIHGTIMWFKRK